MSDLIFSQEGHGARFDGVLEPEALTFTEIQEAFAKAQELLADRIVRDISTEQGSLGESSASQTVEKTFDKGLPLCKTSNHAVRDDEKIGVQQGEKYH